ncbi:hypothetical protein Bhyg_17278 [Pseudolycoriella hygida]|uniref:Uncharacterized protein n=1 Tax=Pseudolycoriella hygida TaxID=35572 RepID=A0A9Q0RW35_9DIPT|nr:hypothetical protein Bhyg_17278 [Pseudolycoriella hygida]
MAQWITDGTLGLTVDGNVVNFDDDRKRNCSAFHALWYDDDGVTSGKHYWKIHFPFLENTAAVGLTSMNLFKRGFACDSICYSGHLGNCGRNLVRAFGPMPAEGDEIGMLAVFDEDRLKDRLLVLNNRQFQTMLKDYH